VNSRENNVRERCAAALAKLGGSLAQIAHPKNSVQVFRAICVFSVTRGTPPMSYYTLFKGWLPLSPQERVLRTPRSPRPLY
jgi:hypothetical protein